MNNTAFRNALSFRAQRVPQEELDVDDWRSTLLFSTRLNATGDISSWVAHGTLKEVVQDDLPQQWVDDELLKQARAALPPEQQNEPLDQERFVWKRRYFTFPRDLYPHMNPKVGVCLTQRAGMPEPRIGLFALAKLDENELVGFCTGEWAFEVSIDAALGDLNRCASYYQNTFGTMVQSTAEKTAWAGTADLLEQIAQRTTRFKATVFGRAARVVAAALYWLRRGGLTRGDHRDAAIQAGLLTTIALAGAIPSASNVLKHDTA